MQGDDPDADLEAPEDGALVHGLFTDAWKWDDDNMCMTESDYGIMNNTLPVFHMLPEMDFTPPKIDYICPLYKEGLRAGTLSTTGNLYKLTLFFVLTVSFRSLHQFRHCHAFAD